MPWMTSNSTFIFRSSTTRFLYPRRINDISGVLVLYSRPPARHTPRCLFCVYAAPISLFFLFVWVCGGMVDLFFSRWSGDINRPNAEDRLRGLPQGTFLTRWSSDGSSFVVSFVKSKTPFRAQHIAYIALQPDQSVKILASDASIRTHESLRIYIESLRRQDIVSDNVNDALDNALNSADKPPASTYEELNPSGDGVPAASQESRYTQLEIDDD
jgi:SH2 domain